MSIESDLKKDGITVVGKLDTLSINTISRDIAEKLCKTFPNQNFIFQNLFIALSRIPMYIADIPEGFVAARKCPILVIHEPMKTSSILVLVYSDKR